MSAFQPGDMVERVAGRDDPPNYVSFAQGGWPARGMVLVVRDSGPFRCEGRVEDGIRLQGIVAQTVGHPDCWWQSDRFRLVYRPKADLIERLTAAPAGLDPAERGAGGRKQAEPASAGEHPSNPNQTP